MMKKAARASNPVDEEVLTDESDLPREHALFGCRRLSALLHPASLSFALVGLLLTTFAASALYRAQKESLAREFNANLESVHRGLGQRLADTEQLLSTVRAYLAAAGGPEMLVGNEEWNGFLDALETAERLPGVRGIGYAAVVSASEVADFESAVREATLDEFKIVSSGEHPIYVPVVRYEMVQSGQVGDQDPTDTIRGFDLMTERVGGKALAWARDIGSASVSPVEVLRGDFGTGSGEAFFVCVPVYKGDEAPNNLASRRARIQGYVFCVADVGSFLAAVVETADNDIGLRFTDSSASGGGRTIFASAESSVAADFRSTLDIHLGAHHWTIEAFSLAAFEDWVSRLSTLFAALSGVAVTLFGMMVLADSKAKQERAAKATREMNRRLRKSESEVRELNAHLEATVASRTASLVEALDDLRSFSYTLSHDLRAPVRHVRFLADLLEEEHGVELSPGAKDYFVRIREAADRMHELIEGILRLASCGRGALRPRRVDVSSLVSEIVEEQVARMSGRVVRVVVPDGMEATADPVVLRTVLQNLLENAFKFTSNAEVAEIVVGLSETERGPEIFVKDNGVGFDMGLSESVFQPFKRLHRGNSFEGIGIGLATVRKMVRRHFGEICVESNEGEGATFRFTLGEILPGQEDGMPTASENGRPRPADEALSLAG